MRHRIEYLKKQLLLFKLIIFTLPVDLIPGCFNLPGLT